MVIDRELDELNKQGVQLRHIGELDGIPHDPPFDISNVAGLHRAREVYGRDPAHATVR